MSADRAARRRAERAGKSPDDHRWMWVAVAAVGVVVLIGAVALGLGGGGSSDSADVDTAAAAGESEVATISYETFDGETRVLARYEGRPLVVNFYASWCVPCLAELPRFEEVYQRTRDDVAFLGLNLQDTIEDGNRIAAETGITYDLGRDPDGTAFQEFGGIAMPTTIFISSKGRIVKFRSGALNAEELESTINSKLLGS